MLSLAQLYVIVLLCRRVVMGKAKIRLGANLHVQIFSSKRFRALSSPNWEIEYQISSADLINLSAPSLE